LDSGGARLDFGHYSGPDLALGDSELVSRLEIEPEVSAVTEKPTKPQHGFRRYPSFSVQDVGESASASLFAEGRAPQAHA